VGPSVVGYPLSGGARPACQVAEERLRPDLPILDRLRRRSHQGAVPPLRLLRRLGHRLRRHGAGLRAVGVGHIGHPVVRSSPGKPGRPEGVPQLVPRVTGGVLFGSEPRAVRPDDPGGRPQPRRSGHDVADRSDHHQPRRSSSTGLAEPLGVGPGRQGRRAARAHRRRPGEPGAARRARRAVRLRRGCRAAGGLGPTGCGRQQDLQHLRERHLRPAHPRVAPSAGHR